MLSVMNVISKSKYIPLISINVSNMTDRHSHVQRPDVVPKLRASLANRV